MKVKQRTLSQSFSLEGKGLHTGCNVKITFYPAPDNHGYKIRRSDLSGMPVINALAENVVYRQRCTVLTQNGAEVSTVEHVLAALYGCEIDNCLLDINGSEFPILDGSSIQFVKKIKEAGVTEQKSYRKYIELKRKRIRVKDEESGSSLLLLPDESFSIQVRIVFDSKLLKIQDAYMDNLSSFVKDFSQARTFVFVKEVVSLLDAGLIKGGDLDNAIIIYDKPMEQGEYDFLADTLGIKHRNAAKLGYIMNRPLIYDNEPARHKLLDVIGDLALTGSFIKGKIIADCPGHKINTLFAKAIREASVLNKEMKIENKII
ncbi:MAG: UDP-3-O-acyl-N-acetylglucosamine deacetylase [Prevotella sp.]|nr:UDP-3-O-acyl-N-acetylglucosamine deacetylase [Prevotella sp.]